MKKFKRNGASEKIIKACKVSALEDVFISLGYGKIKAKDVIFKALQLKTETDEQEETKKSSRRGLKLLPGQKKKAKSSSGVLVSGLDHVLITFAKCCSPLPGEEIAGFITRGRGVSGP